MRNLDRMEKENKQSNVVHPGGWMVDGYCPDNTWSRTMQLRWKRTQVSMRKEGVYTNVLQQMWKNDLGQEKWEPVEFVE